MVHCYMCSRRRQNLKFGHLTLLFCGVRQKCENARKFVLHVQDDYYCFLNQGYSWFVALCFRSRRLCLNSQILRSTTAKLTKTSPHNITVQYCKYLAIIPSRSRVTMWAKYPKNKWVRAVSKLEKRMKDSLLRAYVVIKTSNLVISRRC